MSETSFSNSEAPAGPATAQAIQVFPDALSVKLPNRVIIIAWANLSPFLANATPEQRAHCELSPGGYGIHWPLLDEDLSVSGLVREHG